MLESLRVLPDHHRVRLPRDDEHVADPDGCHRVTDRLASCELHAQRSLPGVLVR
jgi:hypothetical protein